MYIYALRYFPPTNKHMQRKREIEKKGETQRALADFFLREFRDNIKEVGASWLGAIQIQTWPMKTVLLPIYKAKC